MLIARRLPLRGWSRLHLKLGAVRHLPSIQRQTSEGCTLRIHVVYETVTFAHAIRTDHRFHSIYCDGTERGKISARKMPFVTASMPSAAPQPFPPPLPTLPT